MSIVIGVRFRKAGKVYFFDPNEFSPKPGDYVIVETARGIEFGEVVTAARTIDDAQITSPLKKVVRIATEDDVECAKANDAREKEAFRICQEKVTKHKLEMKVVSVEYTFDRSKIVFYFTANGRVDFRELVKDLASVFKMRIELRQIGVRDEAKMLGGLGSCGRPICCGTFLGDFQPVSIKMAKDQNLSLNPTKISGLCGRLMCCLKYEQENYEQTLKKLPKVGNDIVTPDGVGVVVEINVIREIVKVRMHNDDDTFDIKEYDVEMVRKPGAGDASAVREPHKNQEKKGKRSAAPAQEESEEGDKKKRYPHPKAPKNMSTNQFMEKIMEGTSPGGDGETKPHKAHKRRRRGKKQTNPESSIENGNSSEHKIKERRRKPTGEQRGSAGKKAESISADDQYTQA